MAGQQRTIVWDAASERAFQRALQRGLDGYRLRTERDLERLGLEILNDTRIACPVNTGRLRSSYQSSGVQKDARGMYVQVGTNVDYAAFVEFGTRNTRPQPHLRPAFLKAINKWGRR